MAKPWARHFERLWKRQKGVCWICSGYMNAADRTGPNGATVDHVIPRSLGGGNRIHNLKLACRSCNEAKANMMPRNTKLLRNRQMRQAQSVRAAIIADAMRRQWKADLIMELTPPEPTP